MPLHNFLQILTFPLALAIWGNAFAELPVERDDNSVVGKTIYLPANYDFGKPRNIDEDVSVLWIDTLQLLNKSAWKPDSTSAPLPIDKALDRAIEVLAASGTTLRKTQMLYCRLSPLLFDAAEDIWIYEVVFDSATRTPVSDGRRSMNLHRVIVLMDGAAFTYGVRPNDEIRANFNRICAFKREQGLWRRDQCITK